MLTLRGTTDLLRVVTGSAATVDYFVCYMETDNSVSPVIQDIPAPSNGQITSATTTTILAAPSASRRFNVKGVTLYNEHATQSTPLRVERYDGTNARPLWNGTLLAGEFVILDELGVWTQYSSGGIIKTGTAKLDVCLAVATDVVNATTSFADITGLTQAVLSGHKYAFEAYLIHVNNASTTGSQFGVNIGASPTTLIVGTIDTVTTSVTASVHSAGVVTALDTAVTAQTTGSTSNRLAIIAGFITPSADGTFAMRCKSEVAVAAGLTVKAGSWLRIRETDN
jgi:hypothetical protein